MKHHGHLKLPDAPVASPASVAQPVNAASADKHAGHVPVSESDLSGGNDTSARPPVNVGDASVVNPSAAPGHPNGPQGGNIDPANIQPGPD